MICVCETCTQEILIRKIPIWLSFSFYLFCFGLNNDLSAVIDYKFPLNDQTEVFVIKGRLKKDSVKIVSKESKIAICPIESEFFSHTYLLPDSFKTSSDDYVQVSGLVNRGIVFPEKLDFQEYSYFDFLKFADKRLLINNIQIGGLFLLLVFPMILNLFIKNHWFNSFMGLISLQLVFVILDFTRIGTLPFFHSMLAWVIIAVYFSYVTFIWYLNFYLTVKNVRSKESFTWVGAILLISIGLIADLINKQIFNFWLNFIILLYLGWHIVRLFQMSKTLKLRTRLSTYVIVIGFMVSWSAHLYGLIFIIDIVNLILFITFFTAAFLVLLRIKSELEENISLHINNVALLRSIGWKQIENTESERSEVVRHIQGDTLNQLAIVGKKELIEVSTNVQIAASLNKVLINLRKYLYELFPPYINDLELSQIIDRQVEALKLSELNIKVDSRFTLWQKTEIDNEIKLCVFRLIQEYVNYFNSELENRTLYFEISQNEANRFKMKLYHIPFGEDNSLNDSIRKTQLLVFKKAYNLQYELISKKDYCGWELIVPTKFIKV